MKRNATLIAAMTGTRAPSRISHSIGISVLSGIFEWVSCRQVFAKTPVERFGSTGVPGRSIRPIASEPRSALDLLDLGDELRDDLEEVGDEAVVRDLED